MSTPGKWIGKACRLTWIVFSNISITVLKVTTSLRTETPHLGGGFKHFLFSPCLGRWSNLANIFQLGWNHQLAHVWKVFSFFRWTWSQDGRLKDLRCCVWMGGGLVQQIHFLRLFEFCWFVSLVLLMLQCCTSKIFKPSKPYIPICLLEMQPCDPRINVVKRWH